MDIKRGVSWSKEQEHSEGGEGRVPVIGIRNVQESLNLDGLIYLSRLRPAVIENKRVTAGWTVIVGSNGNRSRIGNAVLVRRDADFLFASFLLAARPKEASVITPEYFYRWLSAEQVQAYLTASAEGTTGLSNLSHSFFRAMAIPVPPPGEQAALIRILDTADAALDCTREAVNRAQELEHSLLHELLERGLGSRDSPTQKHPPHWTVRRVDEVADVGSGLTLGKDLSGIRTVERPYLRVANVQDGHLDLSTMKTVRVPVHEVESFQLESGDVLMTEGGDIDKLGRGTIWRGEIPGCLHQNHVFRIRPKRDVLVPDFYALVVESDIAKRYFNRVAKRTTNLASTNKTQVRAFRFPVPPTLEEQQEVAAVMRRAKDAVAALLAKERVLRSLKRSLAHDLLTGRVQVLGTTTEAKAVAL